MRKQPCFHFFLTESPDEVAAVCSYLRGTSAIQYIREEAASANYDQCRPVKHHATLKEREGELVKFPCCKCLPWDVERIHCRHRESMRRLHFGVLHKLARAL
mmetsp:Transcript_4784/g.6672  ORF Transcript_4784/g.6672 Transcript_4784/m.6672 type:complete len:102 (-) Transcript_4784:504-809(-)